MNEWWIYYGDGQRRPLKRGDRPGELPQAPPWRQFTNEACEKRGTGFQVGDAEKELINAALYLRRPLLITGPPGTGKSTLAYAVAQELDLGEVLRWSITTRSTLQEGLYHYDAIARLQDAALQSRRVSDNGAPPIQHQQRNDNGAEPDIGKYLRLGPLGTALLPCDRPQVLLIDEIDKSDIDLPNDLLHIFEEGEYEILELARLPADEQYRFVNVMPYKVDQPVQIERGRVRCDAFPFVVLTSNGERDFPAPFLRRCLRLEIKSPDSQKLAQIVKARLDLDETLMKKVQPLINTFDERRDPQKGDLATDQLLNAVYPALKDIDLLKREPAVLIEALWRSLISGGSR